MKVLLLAGARPNFMKIAPVMRALSERPGFSCFLVHTGQHYDEKMSRVFFDELSIPRPDLNLEVGSGSHARQTAEVMLRLEPVLLDRRPDLVVVVGDVNSTVAGALTSVKLGIPVAHVEAGLRSFDESMPEEINRRITDSISELLFVSEPSGVLNLEREGVAKERIHLVGNVMIDTLLAHRDRAREREAPKRLGVEPGGYALLTLHRPANVDEPAILDGLLDAFEQIAGSVPLLFPAHPRTTEALERAGLLARARAIPGLRMLEPLGYLDFLSLLSDALVVLTDSGGIQEETTVLGVPCLTLRENTERPVTVDQGTNRIVGRDPHRIVMSFGELTGGEVSAAGTPALWDGRAALRIAEILGSREETWRDT